MHGCYLVAIQELRVDELVVPSGLELCDHLSGSAAELVLRQPQLYSWPYSKLPD